MSNINSMAPYLTYAHKPIDEKRFIFPITGLRLSNNKKLSIGDIDFVDRVYLENNIIDQELVRDSDFINYFAKVNTFAIVDLDKFGDCSNLCDGGYNSLALQLLKQSIGAIYLSMYNKKDKCDSERRIIISDQGVHEVDEGLSSYLATYNGKYMICSSEVSSSLVTKENDFDVNNIQNIIILLKKNIKERTEFENKICKSLELVYSIFIESYTSERVFKLTILLNFIFNQSEKHDFDINDVGRKLRIIFNVIENKKILENIPRYICPKELTTDKISPIIVDIYSRVRNKLMHGKINPFIEFAVINLEDYMPLKITALELLNSILNNKELIKCKTAKEFDIYIEGKESERIEKYKSKRLQK